MPSKYPLTVIDAVCVLTVMFVIMGEIFYALFMPSGSKTPISYTTIISSTTMLLIVAFKIISNMFSTLGHMG